MVHQPSTEAAQQGAADQQHAFVAAAAAASGRAPTLEQPPAASPGQQQQLQPAQGSDATPAAGECMGCRLTGLALGVVGGGYVASRLVEPPYPKGAHRLALISVSAGLFALGVGRALGF